MARKKCPACGKKIDREATYCIYCRTWLERSTEQKMRDAIVEETLVTLAEDGYDSALHMVQAEQAQQADEFATRLMDVPAVEDTASTAVTAPLHTMVIEDADDEESAKKPRRERKKADGDAHSHGKLWLYVSLAAFLVIGFVFVSLVVHAARSVQQPTLGGPAVTTTTRNAQHDAWLQMFLGEWVDESSRGKKDLQDLGGHGLYVHEIVGDTVIFDVYAYDPTEANNTAYVMNVHAKLFDDVLHFTFSNDARGHSGEGFMRLCEAGIETEILINNAEALAEDENSLAVNALFVRRELPHSDGIDLKDLKTLDDVKAVAGEQTAPVAVNKTKKISTYTFGALSVKVRADNTVYSMSLDYGKLDDKTTYCYDNIDGTMAYDVVKMYFGEAEHDYLEQPTDIRVLHYLLAKESSVTFTFDSDSQLLLHIQMDK